MGRATWLQKVRNESHGELDALAQAERQFSMAVAAENQSLIEASPKKNIYQDIQTTLSNITKNTCRISDYKTYETPEGLWTNRKAESAMVHCLNRVLKQSPPTSSVSQQEVWNLYRQVREIQVKNEKPVVEFANRHGGYSFSQHMLEYNSLGWLLERLFTQAQTLPAPAKVQLFHFSQQMINLTNGVAPEP